MSLLSRANQLRLRRIWRYRKRQVRAVTGAAEKQFDTNLIGRFDRFWQVRRFALGWLLLVALITTCTVVQTLDLSGYYQTIRPVAGGIYNEGMVGTYSNADPIFATGAVDIAVSRLVFAGLFKYNDQNHLVGDLATSYSVDQTGKHYEVKLKPGLTWQDGRPLTARDVVFTYKLIQDPETGSPFLQAWQSIHVSAPNKLTVDFDLPNAFSAFPYSLVSGIVPEHILGNVPPAQLRSNSFNTTTPVGAGPFAWQAFQASPASTPDKAVSLIALQPFADYNGGSPKLSGFVLHAFGSQSQLIQAFQKHVINAMAGLDTEPKQLEHASGVTAMSFPSTAAVMTFFKTGDTSSVLADKQVRLALVQGADTAAIIGHLGYVTKPVREPLLMGQLGYDPQYRQAAYDPAAAAAILTRDGWLTGSGGMRYKDGRPLAFRLYGEDTQENRQTSRTLIADWRKLGVKATAVLQPLADFQTTLQFHTYDALLYGISIGVDPDVFAYWDSSQADIRSPSRLNFSEYKSAAADASLEAGRTRLDPALRAIKYKPFLAAWQADAPALGLYQPRYLYITRGTVYGLNEHTLNTAVDRYESVAHWEINTAKVTD